MNTSKSKISTKDLVITAALTAFVVVLQLLGSFIKFGTFSISLVLVPIVIGAAVCGIWSGAWLGFVFGFIVMLQPDTLFFIEMSFFGTLVTVMVKGIACGLVAAVVYKLLANVNRYLAVFCAAVACPVANTGIFLLGTSIFFTDYVRTSAGGANAFLWMIVAFVGFNFLFELVFNLLLSPAVVRILDIIDGKVKNK